MWSGTSCIQVVDITSPPQTKLHMPLVVGNGSSEESAWDVAPVSRNYTRNTLKVHKTRLPLPIAVGSHQKPPSACYPKPVARAQGRVPQTHGDHDPPSFFEKNLRIRSAGSNRKPKATSKLGLVSLEVGVSNNEGAYYRPHLELLL